MSEPGFGEIEYDQSINTPSKSRAYYEKFHAPLISEARQRSFNHQITVLNVACGPGHEFEFMEDDPGLRLVGFDISPELVKQAQERFKDSAARADVVLGTTKRPPVAENSIDVGIAVNAVIYNPNAVLDTLHYALRPGGNSAVNFRVFGNKFNEPFYQAQIEKGAIIEDKEIEVDGEKFELKVVNYATHESLPQLGEQVYFTSESDIERFVAAKGFAIAKHDKFHYASVDNPDNEVEVYKLEKPELKDIHISSKYRESGDELIIFLHGLGCTKDSFAGAWEAKPLEGYSLLATDFVGYGDSSRPEYFSYRMKEQADRIMLELDKYPHKKIHTVAHSVGDAPGLFLAERLGDRLGSFINVEGTLNILGPSSARAVDASYDEFKESVFSRMKDEFAQSSDPGWRLWAEWMQKADSLGFYRSSKDLARLVKNGELVQRFRDLKARKAYVYGERSAQRLVPVLLTIPDVQKIVIPDSEHFSMTDNPKVFYEQLSQLLARKG